MSTFNYIKVTGISEAIPTEDIVAHFQTAECGGGTVSEVIILGPHKSVGLVRIEQISLDSSHELFKREHKIGKTRLRVEMAPHEPSPDQCQNAAYKIGTPRGTTSSVPATTRQLPQPHHISLPWPDPSPIVCLDSKKGASNIFVAAQSNSASSDTKLIDTTDTAVNSYSDTKRPSTQPANIRSNSEDDRNPSYIMISGLTDNISTEDIVAHFQTARCGGGTVTEVIHLEQSKAKALVGITGIELNSSHKIFKGVHKIGKLKLQVQAASTPPTCDQRQNAVYSIDPQSTPPSATRQQTALASFHTIMDQQKITPPTCIRQQIWAPISTDQKTSILVTANQQTPPHVSTYQETPLSVSTNQETPPPVSADHKTLPPVTTNQESMPPVATNCDQQTPPHIRTIQQNTVKDLNPSYIIVSGLTDSISTEDIVAHFQTARCGGGTVTEVTFMEQNKAKALVGISGIELDSSHKLFKGMHKIGGIRLNIENFDNTPIPAEVHNPSPPTNSNGNVGSSVRKSSAPLESISLDPSSLSVPGKGPSVQTASNIRAPSVVGQQQKDKQSSLCESSHTGKEQTGWSHRVIMEQPKGQPGLHKPTHIGSTSKNRNPSYIIVSCLVNSISTKDIVAYFQTARCGEGTVTEVIYLGQSKALVGISGIELNSFHQLLKGIHVIRGMRMRVKMADRPPTSQQIKNAAYIADEDRMPIRSSSKKRTVEEPYRLHSIPRDRSQSGYQRLNKVHDRLGRAGEPVHTSQEPEDKRHAYHQQSSSSRTVQVDTYKPSGTSGPVDMHLPTSPQTEVQQGVAQSSGNSWPDPFADDGRSIPRMPPLEDDRGSLGHVAVTQPVGPHPPILGGQYTNRAPHKLQQPLTMIEPHPITSGNTLPNSKRAPPGFYNPPIRKEANKKTGNNDFCIRDEPGNNVNQPPPVLSIKVEGIPKDWDENILVMAFDNPDLGGGEITSMRGDVITFKDPKVTERLLSRGYYEVMGRMLKMSLYKKEPDPLEEVLAEVNPGNTLVLYNVPSDIKMDQLLFFLELTCGLRDNDFRFHHLKESRLVLMTLMDSVKGDFEKHFQSLCKTKRPLVRETKLMLKVERLQPVTSVTVNNIKEEKNNKDYLQLYFGNKSKSGGAEVKEVKVFGRGKALVTFKDPNSVQNVLSPQYNHMKALGDDVTLQMYHPILSRHYLPSSGHSEVPLEDAKVYEHRPFEVSISQALTDHLKKTGQVSHFSDRLKDSCASAKLEGQCSIVVTPLNGSQYNPEWNKACRAKVKEFQEGFEEETIKVPSGVADKVYPVIIANINNPEVTISPHSGDVVLVGRKVEVEKLKETVKRIVYQNLDTVLNEALPPPVLVCIKKCSAQRLEKSHRVLLKVDIQNESLQISGTSASCDSALKEIRSLTPAVIDVRLGEEGVALLATPTGTSFLYSKIGQHPVGHYFTGPDGSVVQGEMAKVSKLHLVAEKHRDAISIAQQLQKTIAVEAHPVPKEFFNQLQSPNWDTTRRPLETNFVAHLIPKKDQKCVVIACDGQHMNIIKESLQAFCEKECYRQDLITLERGEWEYLEKYSKDWTRLAIDMEKNDVKVGIPSSEDKTPSITLKGEATPVREFSGKIRGIMGAIAKEKKEISRPGIAKHFLSASGKHQLKGIGSDHNAVVHLTTLDEQNREEEIIRSSSSHGKLCTGTTGRGVVNIMFGDLTEFHVDVIVNAANEHLNHSGGIAGIISRKGGPGIQADSDRYTRQHGALNVGEAVLLKSVGSLPCKAIVHAVGPRWRDGRSDEEALLVKAVRESLKAAKEYRSIGFPAISSGIFGMPVDVCARAMMKGIVEFFKDTLYSNLSEVTIMMYENKSVQRFLTAARNHLQDVMMDPSTSSSLKSSLSLPSTGRMLGSSKPFTRHGSTSVNVASAIQLKRGGLTSHQADVYVNTAHQKLDLKHGAVAQSLLRSGGPALQAECNQYISQHGSVPVWSYATTGGGNLGCKHVIHAVGTNYDGPGGSAEKGMERMLSNIMAECDRLGVSSVAFPAIGTGALGFPNDTVAKTMIQAISTYLHKHPTTSVKQVLLVIFEDRTYKAFQSVMQTSTSVPTPSYTPGAVQQPSQSLYDHADMSHFEEQGGHPSFTNPPPAAGQHAVLQSFTCNRVAIDIVHSDITAEDCDGLVSTSSGDLTLHDFGVMGALLRKGGPELQSDCTNAAQRHGNLSSSKVIVTGAGRPGGLKCRKILHVLAPKKPDGLCKVVKEVLKKADGERLGVVALPAIGTGAHGFSAEQAAEGICDAIVEFSKESHEYVNHIKVVLFQEELYSSFSTAFATTGSRKGIVKKAWSYAKSILGLSQESGSSSGVTPLPLRSLTAPPGVTENTVLCIKVYAGSLRMAQLVLSEVEKVVEENFIKREVKDKNVDRLSRETKLRLEREAKESHVVISFDPAPLNRVIYKGNPTDVAHVMHLVNEELKKIEHDDLRRRHAEALVAKIQWQWKKDNNFQDYDPRANMEIEEAFQSKNKTAILETADGPVTVDTRQMREVQASPPYSSVEIRRRDFEKERKEGEKPSTWDPMPIDPTTGSEVVCHLVDLLPHSKEYQDVSQAFHQTMTVGAHLRRTAQTYQNLKKIQRVQNPKLWGQYMARKKVMEKDNPQGYQNERRLFHGCSQDSVQPINYTGFNRSYAGRNATSYGKGMYFARDANLSASYAVSDVVFTMSSGGFGTPDSHMYFARVLTGEYTQGSSSMLVPPAKSPTNQNVLYDSVVDKVANPSIFVVFYDAQAYPEYLITFC